MSNISRYLARQAFKMFARFSRSYYVIAVRDPDAGVWYVAESSIPGLSIEAESRDELVREVQSAAPELLALNSRRGHNGDDGANPILLDVSFRECLQGAT